MFRFFFDRFFSSVGNLGGVLMDVGVGIDEARGERVVRYDDNTRPASLCIDC